MANTLRKQTTLGRLGGFSVTFLEKFEILIIVFAVFGVAVNILKFPFSEIIVTIPFFALAILFYLRSYAMSGNVSVSIRDRNIDKFYYYSIAIAILGILFQLNGWQGYNAILAFGGVGLLISLVLILIFKSNQEGSKILDKYSMPRIIIILIIVILLKIVPAEKLIQFNLLKELPKQEQVEKQK
jgi:hypothetical protein